MARPTIRTGENRERILEVLSHGGSYTLAAEHAGTCRSSIFDWKNDDPEFAAACEAAVEQGTDRLEDEAFRRAMSTSDTMLIFALKARRREKWGDKQQIQHSGEIATKEQKDAAVAAAVQALR